jgi:hypothetical protein
LQRRATTTKKDWPKAEAGSLFTAINICWVNCFIKHSEGLASMHAVTWKWALVLAVCALVRHEDFLAFPVFAQFRKRKVGHFKTTWSEYPETIQNKFWDPCATNHFLDLTGVCFQGTSPELWMLTICIGSLQATSVRAQGEADHTLDCYDGPFDDAAMNGCVDGIFPRAPLRQVK